jgi:hypothetical protein
MDTATVLCGPFEVTEDMLDGGLAPSIWKDGGLPQLLTGVSGKMKSLLTMLRVHVDEMSPFLHDYTKDIKDEMTDPFLSYMPEASNEVMENDEGCPDIVVQREVLHQRIIDELLSTFEGKGESEPATTHDRELESEGESDSDGSNMDNGVFLVGHCSLSGTAMAAFQTVLELAESTEWEKLGAEVVQRAMSTMDLKKRDKGSTSLGQKAKSLISRWFTKIDVKELIKSQRPNGSSTTAVLGNVGSLNEHGVIVRVRCNGDCDVLKLHAVLAVFNKHYNKWFMLGPSDTFPMFQQANSRKQTPTTSSSDDGNAASTRPTPITKNRSTKGKRKRKKDPEPIAATQVKKKRMRNLPFAFLFACYIMKKI